MRIEGYDYSKPGKHFITICCQNRVCLFGEIVDGNMILNDSGKMVEKWYFEIENKYPDKRCLEMVVMPNHFHCVIENVDERYAHIRDVHTGTSLCGRPERGIPERGIPENEYGLHNKKYNATIPDAMDWFKTMTTNEYIRGVKNHNWKRFDKKLWQRSYHDRIIGNVFAYARIATYILKNPEKWDNDSMK
jgi:REP element-mobilizing transposase RayT